MSGELKPCPFCGGEPEKRLGVGEWWVSCPTCEGHSRGCSNYDAAIKAWNTRALSTSEAARLKAEARVRELEEALGWFVRNHQSLTLDVQSAHASRGNGASQWMREDDREFRSDLRAAFTEAHAALSSEAPTSRAGDRA